MDVDKGGPCRSLDNIAAAVNCAVMRGEEGRGGVNNCCQLCVCVCVVVVRVVAYCFRYCHA